MKKVLVFGGAGLVGSRFIDLNSQNFEINAPDVSKVDILNKEQVLKAIEEFDPDSVVNLAAFTNVEEAENQTGDKSGICFLINATGAKNVAESCKALNKRLVHISTEYIFDGAKQTDPYTEEDKPNPVNWYGQTKYFGEQFVLESKAEAVIMRISMPFRANYDLKKDVARFFLDQLKNGNKINALVDQKITPTLIDDISHALQILIDNQVNTNTFFCSKTSTTPYQFANAIARVFNLDASLIQPISFEEYNKNKKAKLLKNSWLNPAKFEQQFGGGIVHSIEDDLTIFKQEIGFVNGGVDSKAGNQI
ncbi:NAD(P)-dependent oxidoreductase [Patescibacteria group bacterium]|nr:NAD(P)-dependent oxidoreductase [Patescibacteria group bacterium]